MISILNSHFLPYSDIARNQEKGIYKKVSLIAKKIFHSLYSNQKTILAGIYSCLLMQKSVTASGFIEIGENSYLSCENMLCDSWNNSMRDHQLFSPIIQFRCDRSHAFFAPFPFINKCMNTLCDHMNRVGRKLPECEPFNNFSSDPLNLFWRELCPNKQSMQEDLKEFCLTGECTENDIFTITMDRTLRGICSNDRINQLGHVVHHTIRKGKKVQLETAKWKQKELLFQLLYKITKIISDTSSYLKKIINIKSVIDPTVIENDIIHNLRNGIEKISDTVAESIKYSITQLKLTQNFSARLEHNLLKIRDKLKNLFFFNTSQGELGNSIDQFVDYPANKVVDLITYSKEAYDSPLLPALANGVPALKGKQYELLLYSIHNWNSSYCFYSRPNMILCRLPLPSSITQINRIFSNSINFYTKNLYCHFIEEDYWCNFGKFLKAVCNNRNITKLGKCMWDHMILELKKTPDNNYQINLVGDCYHEIFIVKKCDKK